MAVAKKKVGIALILIGAALLLGSSYIMGQVEEGRGKLSNAQSKLDGSGGLFKMNPVTEAVGKQIQSSAQKKINAYSAEADRYATIASWLKIGGVLSLAVGVIAFFLGRKR